MREAGGGRGGGGGGGDGRSYTIQQIRQVRTIQVCLQLSLGGRRERDENVLLICEFV